MMVERFYRTAPWVKPCKDPNDAARRIRPDVVSVGSVGRTGLPDILLGSVAGHVLREVSCDVLVAKSESIRFELP